MGLIRAIFTSKLTTLLSLVAALIGLLTQPEFVGLVPADWSAWLASVGVFVSGLSRGLVDADGDGIPDVFQGRSGAATSRMMIALLAIGVTSLVACAAANAAPGSLQEPRAVSVASSVEADTASVRVRCTVPANTTCRWASNVGAAPDGIEATFKFAAPAPGDSVQVTGSARAVRRGLVSATATPFAAWIKRGDVAPGAPDSVIVVEIVVPPVVN